MHKQVKLAIVRSLVDFEFPELETVLDMLFTADNMNEHKEVSIETFRQWILRDVKVDVSERDLRLFVQANPAMNKKSGHVDKEDLLEIFGDSYRQARFEFIDKNHYKFDDLSLDVPSRDQSINNGRRVLNEDYYRNMATTPQFAPDRISKIDGKSEAIHTPAHELSYLKELNQDESFKVKDRPRQDTFNMR